MLSCLRNNKVVYKDDPLACISQLNMFRKSIQDISRDIKAASYNGIQLGVFIALAAMDQGLMPQILGNYLEVDPEDEKVIHVDFITKKRLD